LSLTAEQPPMESPLTTEEPLILALETSSRIGSVALGRGPKVLAESTFSAPLRHSAEIFPTITRLMDRFSLKPAQIRHVYLSIGPGSFTGLRIAVTIAKVMHLANPVKIVAVDTLDVIAANVADPQGTVCRIAPVLDAKRNQFFVALYHRCTCPPTLPRPAQDRPTPCALETWRKVLPASLLTAAEFLQRFADPHEPVYLLGDGLLYHKDKFRSPGTRFLDQEFWSPRAANVHALGWQLALAGTFTDPLTLTPNYLRQPEAKEKYRCPSHRPNRIDPPPR